ncbi:MAG: polymer-forming cytoskeletal protein [Paracoccaceae bacterium]
MFSKTADPTAAPSVPGSAPAASGNAGKSVLGNDLKITGEITSKGAVEVFAEIDGNITADTLIVGAEGRVSGSIQARVVEVKGHVDGKIATGEFTMRGTAQVAADVTYNSIFIENGAQIEGRFTKTKG